jgi:hypothetical protein
LFFLSLWHQGIGGYSIAKRPAVIPQPVNRRIPGQGAAGIEAEPDWGATPRYLFRRATDIHSFFSCWFTAGGAIPLIFWYNSNGRWGDARHTKGHW